MSDDPIRTQLMRELLKDGEALRGPRLDFTKAPYVIDLKDLAALRSRPFSEERKAAAWEQLRQQKARIEATLCARIVWVAMQDPNSEELLPIRLRAFAYPPGSASVLGPLGSSLVHPRYR